MRTRILISLIALVGGGCGAGSRPETELPSDAQQVGSMAVPEQPSGRIALRFGREICSNENVTGRTEEVTVERIATDSGGAAQSLPTGLRARVRVEELRPSSDTGQSFAARLRLLSFHLDDRTIPAPDSSVRVMVESLRRVARTGSPGIADVCINEGTWATALLDSLPPS